MLSLLLPIVVKKLLYFDTEIESDDTKIESDDCRIASGGRYDDDGKIKLGLFCTEEK